MVYCYSTVQTVTKIMSTWIVGRDLMKHRCQIKKAICSNLNMTVITHADYKEVKKVLRDFELKHFVYYHSLCVQSDTLLLGNIFENI